MDGASRIWSDAMAFDETHRAGVAMLIVVASRLVIRRDNLVTGALSSRAEKFLKLKLNKKSTRLL